MDLVYVAQALHWFDFDRFYAEVKRILKPKAILAATIYQHAHITPALDPILRNFHDRLVGPHWPPRTKWSRNHDKDISFPFDELEAPTNAAAEAVWTYPDLLGYLESWSATQRHRPRGRSTRGPEGSSVRDRETRDLHQAALPSASGHRFHGREKSVV